MLRFGSGDDLKSRFVREARSEFIIFNTLVEKSSKRDFFVHFWKELFCGTTNEHNQRRQGWYFFLEMESIQNYLLRSLLTPTHPSEWVQCVPLRKRFWVRGISLQRCWIVPPLTHICIHWRCHPPRKDGRIGDWRSPESIWESDLCLRLCSSGGSGTLVRLRTDFSLEYVGREVLSRVFPTHFW